MKELKKHIFLIGMMGSGKSAVAKELSSILNYDLIDLDQKIVEKYGKSIERIFLEEGEIVFRGYEAQTARELKMSNPTVIATGGGFPVRAENRKWMKKNGKVIWLKCNSVVIFERIKNEDRPLLPKPIRIEHIENILKGRTPIYTLADMIINTDRLTAKEAAEKDQEHDKMKTVKVNIAERSYRIMIDQHLLMSVGEQIRPFLSKGNKVALLVSKTVKKLYSERVIRSLITSGYDVDVFLIPSGEENKNLSTVSTLYDELIENAFDRSCLIIALGGGIVGDISGFVASSIYRGIPFIQLPTTLLSQVDSSVGGKVGVNHSQGKNLIGAFYQPKIVLIDPTVLKTLEVRELICGYGEILKYGFIRDGSFLQMCLDNKETLFELKDMELVSEIIRRSVEIKAEIVSEDEQENGTRMFLNFGHTIGHTIEKSCGYGNFLHGEAVILGMCAALKISMDKLGLDPLKGGSAIDTLGKIKLGYDLNVLDIDKAMMALMRDKKIRDGKLNFVLLKDIGTPVIVNDITPGMVRETLVWLKERYTIGAGS